MHVINSESSMLKFISDIREMYHQHKYLRVTTKTGKSRSHLQNSHSHVWYNQIAEELREDTALGVKCFCKLMFGVPILYAEDEDFREQWRTKIKPLCFTHEQLKILMEHYPVTSLMTKSQLKQYESMMQERFASRVKLEYIEKK